MQDNKSSESQPVHLCKSTIYASNVDLSDSRSLIFESQLGGVGKFRWKCDLSLLLPQTLEFNCQTLRKWDFCLFFFHQFKLAKAAAWLGKLVPIGWRFQVQLSATYSNLFWQLDAAIITNNSCILNVSQAFTYRGSVISVRQEINLILCKIKKTEEQAS